jgi:chemosensory pili system protein ChpA (sensor histidine kinase/response regulator)
LERIAQIQQERLEAAAAQRRGDSGQGSDPQVLGLFLSEGMDILLDAEELLAAGASIRRSARNWAHDDELTTLRHSAQLAELPQMAELRGAAGRLRSCSRDGGTSPTNPRRCGDAHEALIGMMDRWRRRWRSLPVRSRSRPCSNCSTTRRPTDESLSSVLPELDMAFIDLDGLSPDDFPAEDEELLLNPRPTAIEDLPEELKWPATEPQAVAEPSQESAPQAESAASSTLDDEMVAIFLEEAVDILDSAGQALDQWCQAPETLAPLSTLQRDLHPQGWRAHGGYPRDRRSLP